MLRINDLNSYNESAQKFLNLIPSCCYSSSHVNYIKINANADGYILVDKSDSISQTSNGSDSDHMQDLQHLLFNYLDYLKDAHFVISNCMRATRSWSCKYDANYKSIDSVQLNNSNNNNNDTNISANNHFVPNGNANHSEEDQEFCSPIGPFLNTLLSRLEAICENDVYTNLQLTGLISRLATYPQPLIRSFFLNSTLIFQSGVKSLWTILFDLHKKLDRFAAQIDNFDELLRKARHFLYAREEILLSKKQLKSPLNEYEFNNRNAKLNRSNSITSLRSETGEGIH
jgi:hypothetical protein